jgi:hypothetical protein
MHPDVKEKLIELRKVGIGSILCLRDFQVLDSYGETEVNAVVIEVNCWKNEKLQCFGFTAEFPAPSGETEKPIMMLLAKVIREHDEVIYGLYRQHEEGLAGELDVSESVLEYDEEAEHYELTDFAIDFSGEEDFDYFQIKTPYPFHDMESDDEQVTICEWENVSEELPDDYWAMYSFMTWHSQVGDDGSEGYASIYFGWEINDFDFTILKV